jgi:site-specific DNA-adenine methylase
MKAPFPWFGGKSSVAHLVWERFGTVRNYVEPFFGSGAVLLARPHLGGTETVNDMDGWLTNFWRAVKMDPDAVAHHADWPVNEIDLMARRDWLFAQTGHIERMERDPHYYDPQLAGVWVWGVCSTIGNAWNAKSTHLGRDMGVHRASTHLGDAGRGEALREYFGALSARLERVRVMCGDWTRVASPAVTTHNGLTAMFLDPPYLDGCDRDVYAHNGDVRDAVRAYALEHGHEMRIALCGYKGEHDMPPDWECVVWKARGGYGNRSKENTNSRRERIWFSPCCLRVELAFDFQLETPNV